MTHARHPKQYPRGQKMPKLQMTEQWKALVLSVLADNNKAGRSPRNPTELARLVGSDKAGMHKMLLSDQPTSKFVRPVCVALGITEPMRPSSISQDEWDQAVADMRALPRDRQEQALSILRTFIIPVDDKDK